ncbi:GNAT family N-acetyltransferase [bacterium]|nr:GNAT family N-acetyltransferase [bacterium]
MKQSPNNLTDSSHCRTAEPKDVPSICRIYNAHIDLGGATFETEHWDPQAIQEKLQAVTTDYWFVMEADSQVVGWSAARSYSQRYGYRLTREVAVYLDPGFIGLGYGRELMKRLETICRRHKIHHLVSRIIASNQASLQFHDQIGYELVGVQKEIGSLNNQWQDVAILQKLI